MIWLGSVCFDEAIREVRSAAGVTRLRPTGFLLLSELVRHPGRVVSRSVVYDVLYGHNPNCPDPKDLDVAIHRLRGALGKHGMTIATHRGFGWSISPSDPAAECPTCGTPIRNITDAALDQDSYPRRGRQAG